MKPRKLTLILTGVFLASGLALNPGIGFSDDFTLSLSPQMENTAPEISLDSSDPFVLTLGQSPMPAPLVLQSPEPTDLATTAVLNSVQNQISNPPPPVQKTAQPQPQPVQSSRHRSTPDPSDFEIQPGNGNSSANFDWDINKKSGSSQSCSAGSGLFRFIAEQSARFPANMSDSNLSELLAHLMAISSRESDGRSFIITDMGYHEIKPRTPTTGSFRQLEDAMDNASLSLTHNFFDFLNPFSKRRTPVKMNNQTNFGLFQMSPDRLPGPRSAYDLSRASGRAGAAKNLEILNGYRSLAKTDRAALVSKCGIENFTQTNNSRQQNIELQNLFLDLDSNCTPGNNGKDEINCFAKWAMLCPALNFDLALVAGKPYFDARSTNKAPMCEREFAQVIADQKRKGNIRGAASYSAPGAEPTSSHGL